jgi:hypothetical protein
MGRLSGTAGVTAGAVGVAAGTAGVADVDGAWPKAAEGRSNNPNHIVHIRQEISIVSTSSY